MAKPFCSEELLTLMQHTLAGKRARQVKRLKVTVLGSAALSAALPAAAQAAEVVPSLLAAVSADPAPPDAALDGGSDGRSSQSAVPASKPDLRAEPVETGGPAGTTAEPWRRRHTIALVKGRSWISGRGDSEWNDTTLTYSVRPTARSGYALEIDRADRFGLTDYQLSVRGDWRIGFATSLYASVSATPAADFREKRGVRVGVSHTVMPHVEVGASTRVGEFIDGPKLIATPYLAVSSKDERATLVVEQINLWNLKGPSDHRGGYGLQLRAQPTDRLRMFAGLARYPEVELGIARDVRSITAGLSYQIKDSIGLSASFASDRYQGLFTRQGVSVGVSYRWRGPG